MPILLKPLMLYDGDCGFCQHWINHWRAATRGLIDFAPYQQRRVDFPKISEAACQRAVQLILPNDQVYSGAGAVLQTFGLAGQYRLLLWSYKHLPGFRLLAEAGYKLVAHRRGWLSRLFGHSGTCGIKGT